MPSPDQFLVETFKDGFAILGDSTAPGAIAQIEALLGPDFEFSLIVADPPYGNILNEDWDRFELDDRGIASWMLGWTRLWVPKLQDRGAFYVWGGVGTPRNRPFFRYLVEVEDGLGLLLANVITWSKRRAYGVQHNYLFTREECAYLFKGPDIKKPRVFNIPLLSEKRGYPGYNKKYPAKSEYRRRTNVWMDITEIMRGKTHPTQKAQRTAEIPIEVHTHEGEWVLDPFAGSGTTAVAARQLGRRFVVFENDPETFQVLLKALGRKSTEPGEST